MPNLLTPAPARMHTDPPPSLGSPVIDPSLSEGNPSPVKKGGKAVHFTASSDLSEIFHSDDSDEDNYELVADLLAGEEESGNEGLGVDDGGDGDDNDNGVDAGFLPVDEDVRDGTCYINSEILATNTLDIYRWG